MPIYDFKVAERSRGGRKHLGLSRLLKKLLDGPVLA